MRFLRTFLALAVAVVGVAAAADDPPTVAVQFAVESSKYRSDLGTSVTTVESAIATLLAKELKNVFKFMEWSAGTGTKAGLKARLISRTGVADVEYFVVLQGIIDGQPIDSPPEVLLFPWTDPPVTENPDLVIASLTTRLREKLAGTVVRNQLEAHFTSNVPLIEKVDVKKDQKQISISLDPAKVQTAETSVLQVSFVADGEPGVMRVNPAILSATSLGCRVVKFDYRDISSNDFHDKTPTALTNVAVTMVTYIYKAYVGTRGRRAIMP